VHCNVLVAFMVGTRAPRCAFGGAILWRLAPGAVAGGQAARTADGRDDEDA
jgi:hypothetical protein